MIFFLREKDKKTFREFLGSKARGAMQIRPKTFFLSPQTI